MIEDDDDDEEEADQAAKKAKTEEAQSRSEDEGLTTLTEDDILPSVPFRADVLAGEGVQQLF